MTRRTKDHKCPHCGAIIDARTLAVADVLQDEEDYGEIELIIIGDSPLICDRWRPPHGWHIAP
jgi:hypothetical protein